MKKFLALLLVLAVLLPAAALADSLILGSNCEFPPFEFVEADGTKAGFDIEIGKLIAAKLGKDLVVDDMNFDGLLMALGTGKVDLILSAMTIKPERQEQADFSEPYFEAQQKIIVRKDYDGIKTLDDVKDKSVAVQDATTGYYLATDAAPDGLGLPAEKVAAFANAAMAILELKQGRVDCVIVDSAPAAVFVSMNDDLVILDGIETPAEFYGIAVQKGNTELLTAVNEVLAEIKANGVYDQLITQFFVASTEE
jgi:polar amino acid transport system substrate-binding protein